MDKQNRPFTTRFDHYNYNVLDLERSLDFYERAFGFHEVKRKVAPDGSYILVYLGDTAGHFLLELTWLRDHDQPYNLGENEIHLCVRTTGDYDAVRAYHRAMECICYENEAMGLYFVSYPDGYWIEVLPEKGM